MKFFTKHPRLLSALYILSLLISITIIILVWLLRGLNEDYKYIITFILLIVTMVITLMFKAHWDSYLFQYKLSRLINLKSGICHTKSKLTKTFIEQNLKSSGIHEKILIEDTEVYYDVLTGGSHFDRHGSLYVVISPSNYAEFTNERLNLVLNHIETILSRKKTKFKNFNIITLQYVDGIKNDTIKLADYVVFHQERNNHLSSINLIIDTTNNAYYYLNSKKYSPNSHYQNLCNFVQKMVD